MQELEQKVHVNMMVPAMIWSVLGELEVIYLLTLSRGEDPGQAET